MKACEARRDNDGKLRYELISDIALEKLAEVYSVGAEKYTVRDDNGNIVSDGSDNWRKGLSWRSVIACVKRHIAAWEKGEDFDRDIGTYHLANAAWNLFALLEYYKTHPELDDRVLPYMNIPRTGLDIDDVLADFAGGFSKWAGIKKDVPHWNYTYEVRRRWKELEKNKDFWMGLEPLMDGRDMPFDPVVYITHRPIPREWVEDWLDKHRFPCVEVVVVGESNGKIAECKKRNVERYVDDKYENFVELNKAGVCTYLWDRPHNRKYDVGYRRITDLKQLL